MPKSKAIHQHGYNGRRFRTESEIAAEEAANRAAAEERNDEIVPKEEERNDEIVPKAEERNDEIVPKEEDRTGEIEPVEENVAEASVQNEVEPEEINTEVKPQNNEAYSVLEPVNDGNDIKKHVQLQMGVPEGMNPEKFRKKIDGILSRKKRGGFLGMGGRTMTAENSFDEETRTAVENAVNTAFGDLFTRPKEQFPEGITPFDLITVNGKTLDSLDTGKYTSDIEKKMILYSMAMDPKNEIVFTDVKQNESGNFHLEEPQVVASVGKFDGKYKSVNEKLDEKFRQDSARFHENIPEVQNPRLQAAVNYEKNENKIDINMQIGVPLDPGDFQKKMQGILNHEKMGGFMGFNKKTMNVERCFDQKTIDAVTREVDRAFTGFFDPKQTKLPAGMDPFDLIKVNGKTLNELDNGKYASATQKKMLLFAMAMDPTKNIEFINVREGQNGKVNVTNALKTVGAKGVFDAKYEEANRNLSHKAQNDKQRVNSANKVDQTIKDAVMDHNIGVFIADTVLKSKDHYKDAQSALIDTIEQKGFWNSKDQKRSQDILTAAVNRLESEYEKAGKNITKITAEDKKQMSEALDKRFNEKKGTHISQEELQNRTGERKEQPKHERQAKSAPKEVKNYSRKK